MATRQLQRARLALGAAYKDALAETNLSPTAVMLRNCQGGFTLAQHLRFTQSLSWLLQAGRNGHEIPGVQHPRTSAYESAIIKRTCYQRTNLDCSCKFNAL